ncbi:MAG: polysaccharide deacetylase family protein [Gammaproteobacteria bacterium]|nr:polysaccharide deacetylase family protein [Gammaproteobacteria bacterium]
MNGNIKKLLLDILTSSAVSPLANTTFGSGVPIFLMHRFTDEDNNVKGTSPQHLKRCLEFLKKNKYNFLSLNNYIRAIVNGETLPKKSVVFTIDDGFQDQIEIAAPIFLEYDCPVTIFLVSGLVDKQLWPWDDQITYLLDHTQKKTLSMKLFSQQYEFSLHSASAKKSALEFIRNTIKANPMEDLAATMMYLSKITDCEIPKTFPSKYQPANWDRVRYFEAKGIEFGPHTVTHRILSRLETNTAIEEIKQSWLRLQQELKSPVPVFCYPTGRYVDYGPREVDIIRDTGLIGGVSAIPAQAELSKQSGNYPFHIPRFCLSDDFEEFRHDLSWLGYIRNKPHPLFLKR